MYKRKIICVKECKYMYVSCISTMSSQTDFKKAFDRVWHEALWATMRKYNINASIIRAIENLYDKAQSAVLFSGCTGE